MKNTIQTTLIVLIIIGLFTLLFPWRFINWGTLEMSQDNVVVVTGYADESSANQTATFNIGVTKNSADKQEAVNTVNNEIASIIQKLKDFGIPNEDIKTQSMSIYQNQDGYYDQAGVYKTRPGDWSASNNIDVKYDFENKEDVTRLTDLIASTGATNVWGPNFAIDNTQSKEAQKALLDAAIKDAHEKAVIIAESSGRNIGKVVSVNETSNGYNPYPMMYSERGMGGGGDYVEPGTSNISKTVTVVFELK